MFISEIFALYKKWVSLTSYNSVCVTINYNFTIFLDLGVMPYLPYSKQSKMRNRGAIAAKLMAQLLCRAGKIVFYHTVLEIRFESY